MHSFLRFIFGIKLYCFGHFLCPSSGVFHCTHNNGICHTGLRTDCSHAVSKPVWHIPLLWWTEELSETVEFYSRNKFDKLVHLVGFIIRSVNTICCYSLLNFMFFVPSIVIQLCNINQQMHNFQINILIKFLVSSACFEHHMFIVRKTICTSFHLLNWLHKCMKNIP